jgi:hypothetical protein
MLCALACSADPASAPRARSPQPAVEPEVVDDTGPAELTPPTEPSDDTGAALPSARALSATCDPDPDHPLRLTCSVLVDPPQTVTWSWQRVDRTGDRWTARWEVGPEAKTGLLAHFNPATDYEWTAAAGGRLVTGTVTTGPLPSDWGLSVAVSGALDAPAYSFPYQCDRDGVFVVDREGRPLAYHFVEEGLVYLDNANRLSDGSYLLLYQRGDQSFLRHFRLDGDVGEVPLEALPGPAHHDAWFDDGLYWVLYRDLRFTALGQLGLDGLAVLDPSGALLARWELGDLYLPSQLDPPYFADVSHANAVWSPPGSRDALISFRHLDLVLRLRADPDAEDFGQVLWQVSGSDRAPRLGPELTTIGPVGSDPGFTAQHHAWLDAEGRLVLFDNGAFGERSRVATWRLDETAGTARLDDHWELSLNCAFQGGAWFSASGAPLATCGPISAAFEFAPPSESDLQASIEISCPTTLRAFTSRIQPYGEP